MPLHWHWSRHKLTHDQSVEVYFHCCSGDTAVWFGANPGDQSGLWFGANSGDKCDLVGHSGDQGWFLV